MNLSELLLPAFINQLQALSGQLDKAIAHTGNGGDALLSARLTSDMLPLSSQIKFSCGQATDTFARLLGQPISVTPDVTTMAEAKALIAETISGLRSVDTAEINAQAGAMIALDLPNGMAFDLTGSDYVRDWVLPQFHFHTSMAYALLRHKDVPIGKADLVPHMMAYFRKPSAT